MSVATMNPSTVPHPHHLDRTTAMKRHTKSPPHPHAHGSHRRRLASPISPLSTTYNTRSLNKTKDEVIAACDRQVQWSFEQEYGQILEKYMKDSEVAATESFWLTFQERPMPSAEMMDLQPELEWYMLPFLVDFMIEVHSQLRMSPYTLHLAINLINRYVSKRIVFKKHYQLVGCACLWIASKFEDSKDKVPTVQELRSMCVSAYTEDMFVQMEGHVLASLGWDLGSVQTCVAFAEHQIARLRGQHGHVDGRLIHLSRFFLDMSLFSREFLTFKPSEVATSSVALARHILGSQEFIHHRYTEREVDCLEHLLNKIPSASSILRRKYAHKQLRNITAVIDDFQAQAARHEYQQATPPSSVQAHCPPSRMSQVKTPQLHIQLPDTPPHTPVTSTTVPATKKPGYIVNGAGLPTPPADDDNTKTVHILPNEYTRGSYGRSESFIVDSPNESPVIIEAHDEDMETDYDSDEDMGYSDEDLDYDYDSDAEDGDIMMTDHHHVPSYHHHHHHHHLHHHHQHHNRMAPRIVLAPVV
jgi:Cyclin, N-terminal domain/Cyclin, C-terminal domain